MKKLLLIFFLLLGLFFVSPVKAHPGGLDAYGGHYCRTNCYYWGYSYGSYHYHRYYLPRCPSFSTYYYSTGKCHCWYNYRVVGNSCVYNYYY